MFLNFSIRCDAVRGFGCLNDTYYRIFYSGFPYVKSFGIRVAGENDDVVLAEAQHGDDSFSNFIQRYRYFSKNFIDIIISIYLAKT